jgi:hypothetical protein
MSDSIIFFDEPELEFRYGQRVKDPHDGLALFGPYDADAASRPRLSYVLLGTESGIAQFKAWSKAMLLPAIEAPKANFRLWSPYPGFEAAFGTEWSSEPVWVYPIDQEKLLEASRTRDKYERTFQVVNYYLEGLAIAGKLDEQIGVAVCIVPDELWQNCRPESYVANPVGKSVSPKTIKSRRMGQLELLNSFEPEQYELSPDFRRQLKARSMQYDIPLQIVRESTLRLSNENVRGQRTLTPLSDRMWNLSNALYYKCGGKPWRLVTARDGVCYIGIAFRRTDTSEKGKTACCAAQMFLNTGDGIVFLLDEYGPWFSPTTRQFHLSQDAARKLLQGVLQTYRDLGGKELTEIFIHSRSTIYDDEFAGYQEACPPGVKLIGVRVRIDKLGLRFFRPGMMSMIRGAFWRLNDRAGFLWGSGFKPRLGTYDGWETPAPLRIDIQHGDAPIERVGQDIFGLTKLNYNACRLGESNPVTVGYSDAVGEILVSNPTVAKRKPNFKFYI